MSAANVRELIEGRLDNIRFAKDQKDLECHLGRMCGYLEALEDLLLITEEEVEAFSTQTEERIHARFDEIAAQTEARK